MAAGYTTHYAQTNDMQRSVFERLVVTDNAATYCHVVMQTGNARYNHFSFGDLDNKGLHAVNSVLLRALLSVLAEGRQLHQRQSL
jgi:hypothetical protein